MLAGGVISGITVYWLRTEPQGIVIRWFRFAMLCGMVWSVCFGLIALVDAPALRLAITNVYIIAVPSASIAVFAVAYEFTFREPIPRAYLLLFVPVVLLFVLSWFNPGELIYTVENAYQTQEILVPAEPGSVRLPLNMIGGPLLTTMAAGLIAGELIRAEHTARKIQAGTILSLIAAGFIPGMAKVLDLVPPYFDPTPIGWALMSLLVAGSIKRFDLFRLAPSSKRQVFEELADPIVILNPNGVVADSNQAAAELFTVELGMTTAELEAANPAINTVRSATTTTQAAVDDGDDERVVEYTAVTLQQGYDTVGEILLFRDITEQAAAAAALEAKTDRLDAFASRVSHDLQSPITVARSYLKIARRADDPGETLSEIDTALTRAETLIEDILAIARGGQQPDRRPVELASHAHQAWAAVSTAEASLTVEGEATISADAQQLLRLFENLFRNAVEHGGSAVTVRVGTTDDGFYVADDGRGIPADEQASIFAEQVSHDAEGTGYGLAIVHDIVMAHDWAITVTDSENGGARFDITGVDFETAAPTASTGGEQLAE
jgi:Signal transduction histidine kinase